MITKHMLRTFSESAGQRQSREFWDNNSKRYGEKEYRDRKENNKERDSCCRICKGEFTANNPRHSDHNIALSKGGTHSGKNVFDICERCHRDKTPHMQDRSGESLFKRG